MKVTLVIYALEGGGAERVMSTLANYCATHGFDTTLIVFGDATRIPFYPLVPEIRLQQLGIIGDSPGVITLLRSGLQRIKILRAAIIASEPEVVVSFLSIVNVLTILCCWNTRIPVIVSERIYPSFIDVNRLWQLMMSWTYRQADLIVLLTQNALPFYPPERGYKAMVIPNPILEPSSLTLPGILFPQPTLIAVGRLHPQKGFDVLLRAFQQLHTKYPEWHLTILGEGPIRAELEELRSTLQLTDCVHLPGQVTNIHAHLRQAEIFVMSSRFEGFPNALGEAMACGLPVVSTDCLSGPSDIILPDVDGILVPVEDVAALVAALDSLMANPLKRQQLAQAAPQVLERFGLDRVMGIWMDTIKSVAANAHSS